MSRQLRVLIIEVSETAAELLVDVLRRHGYDVTFERVDSAETMMAALDTHQWDIILSDYTMAGFSASAALKLAQDKGIDTPFIIVNGTVGEEAAAAVMKAGAHDFLLKDNLARLVPAIERALGEVDDRRKRLWAEDQLRQSEGRFSRAFQAAPVGITISLPDGRILDANDRALTLLGFNREEVIGRTSLALNIWVHPEDWPKVRELLRERQPAREIEIEYRTKSGEIRSVLASFDIIEWGDQDCVIALFQDITERKRAEEALHRSQAAEHDQRTLAEALCEITAILTSTLDLSGVMRQVLETVGRVVPHDAASIMLVEADAARVAYSRGYPPHVVSLFDTYRFPLNALPSLRQMMATGMPHVVADTSAESEWVELGVPGADWSRSFVGAPIWAHGRVIGFLNLDSAQPGYYTPIHAERLQAFADQAAIAIENASLYDEVRRHAAELEQRVAQRTAELQQAQEHVETILNTSSDGIALIDADGAIQQANPAFVQMFGFTEEGWGKSLQELVEPSERTTYAAALRVVRQQRQPARLELTCVRSDGTLFDADAALAPLAADKDDDPRVICSLRDISQRKQLEAELRAALTNEKEHNELKSRFVSMVSHEFRTPLASILLSSQLVRNHRDRMSIERQLEHLDRIGTQVRHLSLMIDDVIAFCRAGTKGIVFSPERLTLETFCRTVVDEFLPTAPDHEIRFNVNGTCEQADIDPKLMRQVLYNLLSNAVKYSPQGGMVSLELTCNQDTAILQLTDRGIGIPKADQARLFEVFYRASNVGSIQGTGLGLAIVKRAVEAHGGSISVESEVGKGTTCTITIPLVMPGGDRK